VLFLIRFSTSYDRSTKTMRRYNKLIAAVLAGLLVAVPLLATAFSDDKITAAEWLEILGAFLPAVFVGLSPANKPTTGDLVDQVNKNPDLVLKQATVTPTVPRTGTTQGGTGNIVLE
jgi:hypothetical protein